MHNKQTVNNILFMMPLISKQGLTWYVYLYVFNYTPPYMQNGRQLSTNSHDKQALLHV